MAKKWKESDLRIGCRLLPGRDDSILEYLSKVGEGERSYEIRKALRIYVQMMSGQLEAAPIMFGPPAPTVFSRPTEPVQAVPDIPAKPPVQLKVDEGEEPSDEDIIAALGGLLDQF